jgi:hypothetical protein
MYIGSNIGVVKETKSECLLIRLSRDDRKALERLSARWGTTLAEAARRSIREVQDIQFLAKDRKALERLAARWNTTPAEAARRSIREADEAAR